MKVSLAFFATLSSIAASPVIAVEHPFLHESGARSAFVGGAYKTCFEKNKSSGRLSATELGQYCLCYARALADSINSSEYEELTLNQRASSTFEKKAKLADTLCTERLIPENRSTPRERGVAKALSQCMTEYHPEDTDYAALVVRERFCICFGSRVFDAMNRPGQVSAEAMKKLLEECESR